MNYSQEDSHDYVEAVSFDEKEGKGETNNVEEALENEPTAKEEGDDAEFKAANRVNSKQRNQRRHSGLKPRPSRINPTRPFSNNAQGYGKRPQGNVNNQRYRWWMGYISQWKPIYDITELETLAANISDAEYTPLFLNDWYKKTLQELVAAQDGNNIQTVATNRHELLREKIRWACENRIPVLAEGIATKLNGTEEWALCYASDNYQLRELSAYLPRAFVRKYGLRQGQKIKAQISVAPQQHACPCIIKVLTVMDRQPEALQMVPHFKELTPYYPTKRVLLESKPMVGWDNVSMRVVDTLTPLGLGQRGLIVAPPRTGKTILLQNIAHAITVNQPKVHLILLLIDERPEEVTDFKRRLPGVEVISSTFDESPENHVRAAEMVIEKAKRAVEIGENVVILLDSITRLARAYNTLAPTSGKVLSGGVEANALQGPKGFFGAARNIENGGSLTILATALIDTGSKMDEVIFEEFKGTGNMELHLDRSLVDKRIFPAINIEKSGTRKEELLYHPDELTKIYSLRRAMKGVVPSTDAMEMLIERIRKTNNNAEFLMAINA